MYSHTNNFMQFSAGTFTGFVVRRINNLRTKHGRNAVDLNGCGRFVLADNLLDIADIIHIDLSDISSLEGQCGIMDHFSKTNTN